MPLINALVDERGDGSRLDAFIATLPKAPSRSACVRLIESGNVYINGLEAHSKSERLMLGDRIQVALPEEERKTGLLVPVPYPLDIRYEDDRLLVLSKQAGLVCHPSPGHETDTLANALVAHCGYEHLGLLQGEDRPGIVHRLDKDTSGLMVAAKDDEMQKALQDLIRLRTLDRRYITLVHGYVAPTTGMIDSGITRSSRDRLKMTVTDDPGAREAITTFTTLERFEAGRKDEGYSLLECHLFTGRTHQIRVHMASIHHPVVGDPLYGTGDLPRNMGLERQFLHSWHIAFEHPETHEMIVRSDHLPADLAHVLDALNNRSMGRTEQGTQILDELSC